ncbi:3-deoxy-D-manno-octulosonate 8-phosphate phosphatase [Niastella vici]|uniref:3-deoxy-D-manno-octulosonate 8-phosphate phosphatase n=1 Tax=Niastella vici TaxID=1703345 RepID=A0A1V9FFA2_9BACT|nr:HAD-IIIA family hydrolase [Niastella vici]OQP56951.1 3-deoxy-D-manno-octulosonate 8-phosphate phosphatase [Niastella vici]
MNILDQFKQVTTFVFDVDGVLTDGTLFVFDDGQFVRRMNIKDGFALQLAVKKGFRVAVISGGASDAVTQRLNRLGINDVFMQVTDKKGKLTEYVQQHNLAWSEVLFMGDDIPDYEVMQQVGMPCAPADAAMEIKQIAKYISSLPGGMGCVREVIEKVLKLNNKWELHTDIASK